MKFQYLLFAFTIDGLSDAYGQGLTRTPDRPAQAVQATCGDKQLARVNVPTIEVRSGSATRSVSLSEIQSIEMTGPVNRINRFAWATVKPNSGEAQSVGIVLPNAGTLILEGVDKQGKPDSIDVLSCRHIDFRTSG